MILVLLRLVIIVIANCSAKPFEFSPSVDCHGVSHEVQQFYHEGARRYVNCPEKLADCIDIGSDATINNCKQCFCRPKPITEPSPITGTRPLSVSPTNSSDLSDRSSENNLAVWKICLIVGPVVLVILVLVFLCCCYIRSNQITKQPTQESQNAQSSESPTNVDEREASSELLIPEDDDITSLNSYDDSHSGNWDRAVDGETLRSEEGSQSGVSRICMTETPL